MDKRQLKKQLKTSLLQANPHLIIPKLVELEEKVEEKLLLAKGDKGDKGEVGAQGIQGISIKGDKGERGEIGKEGAPGRNGRDGVDGRDGKDATFDPTSLLNELGALKNEIKHIPKPLTPEQLINAINELKSDVKIDAKRIKGLPDRIIAQPKGKKIDFSDMRWHGGGITFSTTYTQSAPITDVNTLTVLNKINVVYSLVINGQGQHLNKDYTFAGSIITYTPALDSAYLGTWYTIVYA